MSGLLMGQVWTLQLQRPQRDLLLAMADHADDHGNCYPGIAYLAWKTDYSERQVQRILRELEALGLVEVIGDQMGRGHVRRYLIHIEKGVKKSPFQRPERVTPTSPIRPERVTSGAGKGDTQMSPEPSVENHQELLPLPHVEQARPVAAGGHAANGNGNAVGLVFDTWKTSTGKTRAQLDSRRRRKIQDALKAYPLADVLAAVQGWANSSHHRGENSRRTVYNDLELLLRDASHIERFRDLHNGQPAPSRPWLDPGHDPDDLSWLTGSDPKEASRAHT